MTISATPTTGKAPARPVTPGPRHLPAQTRERLEQHYGRIGLPALAAALQPSREPSGPHRAA